MAMIEQRHPAFKQLLRRWRAAHCEGGLPSAGTLCPAQLADLARVTVTLSADEDGAGMTIASSGEAVDALYGVSLTGSAAARLTPDRDDAEREARCAIETGRPLLIEDELCATGGRQRIARLYLPLANNDGSPDGVLCGVVALA